MGQALAREVSIPFWRLLKVELFFLASDELRSLSELECCEFHATGRLWRDITTRYLSSSTHSTTKITSKYFPDEERSGEDVKLKKSVRCIIQMEDERSKSPCGFFYNTMRDGREPFNSVSLERMMASLIDQKNER